MILLEYEFTIVKGKKSERRKYSKKRMNTDYTKQQLPVIAYRMRMALFFQSLSLEKKKNLSWI